MCSWYELWAGEGLFLILDVWCVMVALNLQKRLAASVLKCGLRKVRFSCVKDPGAQLAQSKKETCMFKVQ